MLRKCDWFLEAWMYVYVYINLSEQDWNLYSLILKRSCCFLFFLDLFFFPAARTSQTFTPDKLWTILCLIVAIINHANAKFALLVAFCLFVYRNLKAIQSPDCLPDLCMCSEWALIHFRTIITSFCAVKSNHGGIHCLLNRTRIRCVHRNDSTLSEQNVLGVRTFIFNLFWGLACLYSHWCMFVCSFVFVHCF